jgi:hypothetical protein
LVWICWLVIVTECSHPFPELRPRQNFGSLASTHIVKGSSKDLAQSLGNLMSDLPEFILEVA